MNKEEFMKNIKKNLTGLPQDEIADIVYDYDEHFRIGKENGKSEEEISSSLGNPKQLAKMFVVDNYLKKAEKNSNYKNVLRAIIATGFLGFMNLFLVFTPLMVIALLILTIFIIGIAFVGAGIMCILGVVINPLINIIVIDMNVFSFVCFQLTMTCIGIIMVIGILMASKVLSKYFICYLKWNIKFIKG